MRRAEAWQGLASVALVVVGAGVWIGWGPAVAAGGLLLFVDYLADRWRLGG
ncbi:MAG: hypothetical protein BWX64_00309 [Acidobacteria bacterium ADurb.Bin051]|nr:MAG: hypothetical protein BWX64_00309 [Acidobacteria bacterium ADurb.Bin051]